MKILGFCVLLSLVLTAHGKIFDTEAESDSRYGQPIHVNEQGECKTKCYAKDDLRITVIFLNGTAEWINFESKTGILSDSLREHILAENIPSGYPTASFVLEKSPNDDPGELRYFLRYSNGENVIHGKYGKICANGDGKSIGILAEALARYLKN